LPRQLDILALEPFYGGARRVMLETLIHCSRHRWLLLKLPPRRIERRLTAASIWFAEQLTRHWVGKTDLLFTSEAMNLADLYRHVPALQRVPSVVYFHSNQLPPVNSINDGPLDLVNLSTASAASEIWFNSQFHQDDFMQRTSAMVRRHPEFAGRNPVPELQARSHVMIPPVSLQHIHDLLEREQIRREKRTIFVETRDADNRLINRTMSMLQRRGERFKLITVGPVEDLLPDLPRITLPEADEAAHARALLETSIFLSARFGATSDHHAVRALAGGCWPLLPRSGVYVEMLPAMLHRVCLFEDEPDVLASRLQDSWHLERPDGYQHELAMILHQFEPVAACKLFDEHLEKLVSRRPGR
jgi:hypothetical protein